MALTVEDGTIVEGADSYVSVDDLRDYSVARGLSLPSEDATLEHNLIKAMDYIEAKRDRFRGVKVSSTQALQWPRMGVKIDNFEIPITVIPQELKNAQCQLAFEIQTTDPWPTTTSAPVKREKVDVVETEYAISLNNTIMPKFPKVEAFLAPLLKSAGINLIRV